MPLSFSEFRDTLDLLILALYYSFVVFMVYCKNVWKMLCSGSLSSSRYSVELSEELFDES